MYAYMHSEYNDARKDYNMKAIFLTIIAICLQIFPAFANEQEVKHTSLPRMVSLRWDKVYARSGPGTKYPIEWIYQQKGAPVEIINEYDVWREIKDWEGSVSWVKKTLLTGKRFVKVITPGENNIYNDDDYDSRVIAKVEDGVVGEVKKCTKSKEFCRIKFDTIEGWVPKKILFGVYENENID